MRNQFFFSFWAKLRIKLIFNIEFTLQPKNLLLDSNAILKVTNFGLSTYAQQVRLYMHTHTHICHTISLCMCMLWISSDLSMRNYKYWNLKASPISFRDLPSLNTWSFCKGDGAARARRTRGALGGAARHPLLGTFFFSLKKVHIFFCWIHSSTYKHTWHNPTLSI